MKVKKRYKIEEVVKGLRKELGKLSLKRIHKRVKEMGYKRVGGGVYKDVYKKVGDNFCIKVYQEEWCWQDDSYIVPEDIRDYYLHPVYVSKKFIVQPWANGKKICGKVFEKIPEDLIDSPYDLSKENIKIHNGRQVIIDFCY